MARDTVGGVGFENGEVTTRSIKTKALHSDCVDGTEHTVGTDGKIAHLAGGVGADRDSMSSKSGRCYEYDLSGGTDTGGGILSEVNPEATNLVVVRALCYVTTSASGANTIDVGVGSGATTVYDGLLDGVNVGGGASAPYKYDNAESNDRGTNGRASAVWKTGEYLTVSTATGASAALVGRLLVWVVDPTA